MNHLMSCREAVRRLWRYLDGDLDDLDARRVEEHLEHCVMCCGELEFVGELQGVLASQQTAQLPEDMQDRLVQFLDDLPDVDPSGTEKEGQ